MSFTWATIGQNVDKIKTWNPLKSEQLTTFKYIDLGSLDKDKKEICLDLVQEIPSSEAPSRARQLVKTGDVLISTVRPNLNGIAVVPKELDGATASTGFCVLRANEEKLDSTYLRYWVESTTFVSDMVNKSTGASYPAVSDKIINDSELPLPPLDTQKHIAAVLAKADQLRKDCKLLEQELNSLAQSVFIDMFGDNFATTHHTLGDVASVVSGVTKGQKFQNQVTVTAPYMRVANVQAGYLNLNEIKRIEVKESDLQKYKLEVGDVLLTEGGDHDKLGRGAIWNGEVPNCIHQNHVFRVRLNTKLYTCEWFNGYLKTTYVKRYFLKCAKKTTNLASINITQLKSLPMPDVTMERQKKFEHIITSINQQLSANLLQLNDAQDYFNVLMQKAFSGELNLANVKT